MWDYMDYRGVCANSFVAEKLWSAITPCVRLATFLSLAHTCAHSHKITLFKAVQQTMYYCLSHMFIRPVRKGITSCEYRRFEIGCYFKGKPSVGFVTDSKYCVHMIRPAYTG